MNETQTEQPVVAMPALAGLVDRVRAMIEAREGERNADLRRLRLANWQGLLTGLHRALVQELGEEATAEAMDCTALHGAPIPEAFSDVTDQWVVQFQFPSTLPISCQMQRVSVGGTWAMQPFQRLACDMEPCHRAWWEIWPGSDRQSRWASTLPAAIVLGQLYWCDDAEIPF